MDKLSYDQKNKNRFHSFYSINNCFYWSNVLSVYGFEKLYGPKYERFFPK